VEAEVNELGMNMLQENQQHHDQEFQSYFARLAALTPQGMLSDARLHTQWRLSEIADLETMEPDQSDDSYRRIPAIGWLNYAQWRKVLTQRAGTQPNAFVFLETQD
jgi:hypothetical protein